jgi:hypothetical protein
MRGSKQQCNNILTEPIFSTYTRHKSDTLKIATWLASTAKECGYTTPSDAGEAKVGVDGKPVKSKGRATKLAKEAEAAMLKQQILDSINVKADADKWRKARRVPTTKRRRSTAM